MPISFSVHFDELELEEEKKAQELDEAEHMQAEVLSEDLLTSDSEESFGNIDEH